MRIKLPESWFEKTWNIVEPQLQQKVDAASKSVPADFEVALTPKRDRNNRPVVLMVMKGPHAFASEVKHGHMMRAVAQQGCDVHRYVGEV
ncbi:hypothetical protein [Corynebacterium heidelbergense]|uniref:Uncharacterized protein n=1 Tax=Corynebacterium heidelbergense TaxID=2055947 RepID=A0A364VE76_9CORY|nr:hypothetical protein [Corynebacterium heidelbergense]RAV34921.1 hypothetical protein CWC39_00865 [Corynebacterium heidelbergense]WCZ36060.1 hypothetical protein CHEID_02470 [Corynebacterium heidelbergense]